jgi:hypothetical protein
MKSRKAREFAQHNAESICEAGPGCGLVALHVKGLQNWLETAYRAGQLNATDLEDLEEKEEALKQKKITSRRL